MIGSGVVLARNQIEKFLGTVANLRTSTTCVIENNVTELKDVTNLESFLDLI